LSFSNPVGRFDSRETSDIRVPTQSADFGFCLPNVSRRLPVSGCPLEPAGKPAEEDAQHQHRDQQCSQTELKRTTFFGFGWVGFVHHHVFDGRGYR
jgi:hypothetical protein